MRYKSASVWDLDEKFLADSMFIIPHTVLKEWSNPKLKRHKFFKHKNLGSDTSEKIKFSLRNETAALKGHLVS